MSEQPAIIVQEIGKDISEADVWKKLTGLTDRDYARMKRGFETCEYNAKEKRGSYTGSDPGACDRIARVNVGSDGKWHLCEQCAALPEFKRFRSREPLIRGQMSREPMSKIMGDA